MTTVTQNETATTTITSLTTSTITNTTTTTVTTGFSWLGLIYMSNASGCNVIHNGITYPEPCFSYNDPYIFNCASSAATAQGCTEQVYVNSTTNSFTVTVWYPIPNSQPGQNCQYSVLSIPNYQNPTFAYCIPINSTSFLVSRAALPPA
jgi:hypothetical protein